MRPMDFSGRVVTSQASIPNRTNMIARRFFFKRDVEKFEHSIFDQTDAT